MIVTRCLLGVTRAMSNEASVSESEPFHLPNNNIAHSVDVICSSSSLHSMPQPHTSIIDRSGKNSQTTTTEEDKIISTNDLIVL